MIKRTIEISKEPSYLHSRLGQLIIQPFDAPKEAATSIPAEDIGVVVIDNPRVTYSHGALQTLSKNGACVVICGKDHIPSSLLLPMSSNTQQVIRLQEQINITMPRQKQLWKQLIISKIKAQAANIRNSPVEYKKLCNLANAVKSGDKENIEAQAAKIYWSVWRQFFTDFRRNPDGNDLINIHLNYGYATLRAATARALVSAGLHPALGLHHRNRSNAFCLADDIIEPLRPIIDKRVWEIFSNEKPEEFNQISKAQLLSVLTARCSIKDETGPLMVQLHRVVASLVSAYTNPEAKLLIPWFEELDD